MDNETLKIYKGDLVQLTPSKKLYNLPSIEALRLMNEKELEDQQKWIRQDPLDSAGEPRLSSRWTIDRLDPGRTVIVLKARCAIWADYHQYTKMVQVMDSQTGNTYYIKRANIQLVA